ncbi:MAG: OmpA family protein [Bacteroidetes bacterium]|nr:OmpA family protein [Bacteroidota bacterium]
MKKITILVSALLFICFNVTAQEKTEKKLQGDKYTSSNVPAQQKSSNEIPGDKNANKAATAQEKSRKELQGDKYAFRYAYDDAIEAYTKADLLTMDGQRRLALSYHKMGQNTEAEAAYAKLFNSQGVLLADDYYNYSLALRANAKYMEANTWMDKFVELKPTDLRAKDYVANKSELPNLLKDDGTYKIIPQEFNSDAKEFGPCYYKNSIVFASTRSSKMFPKIYNWTRKPFGNMEIAEVVYGQMKSPENFDKKINGKLHDGPASFSKDGNFMAFTRNNYKSKTDNNIVELQIWFSNYTDGKWAEPVAFAYNQVEFSVGQPCLTADGKTMYFTSDMSGGYGGSDIYKSVKNENGQWSIAVNLGDKVNTEGDELFPFIGGKDGLFIFSSNGHYGLGGLDIFMCNIDASGVVTNVHNAGYPLNTQFDDFGAILNDSLTNGYFSSNRDGGKGNDDIYAFDFHKPIVPIIDNISSNPPEVTFTVNSPNFIPVELRVRETFPVRNYVFFDLGSTIIPDRYVLIKKEQVKEFKEDQLEVFTPKKLSGRSDRQMTVYYNVLNILGDRMQKHPETSIRLAGASMQGIPDGLAMAESVKSYLVNVFGIKGNRIATEGRIKPRIPSEHQGGVLELELLRQGDRRVSIWSTSPEILMEFQSGPDAPLKPVQIVSTKSAPAESNVVFNNSGSDTAFTSWSMEIKNDKDSILNFGPFNKEVVSLPAKSILGNRQSGDYKVTMIGTTKDNKIIKKDAMVHLEIKIPAKAEEMMRFSIIYEFNDSKSIAIYDKYLTQIVCPKIPQGGTVIIHGYTDIIGEEGYNQNLSAARANDVKNIIKNALAKADRKDVKIEANGFGEDPAQAPFANKYPEERFYNRTVIIDILPAK